MVAGKEISEKVKDIGTQLGHLSTSPSASARTSCRLEVLKYNNEAISGSILGRNWFEYL